MSQRGCSRTSDTDNEPHVIYLFIFAITIFKRSHFVEPFESWIKSSKLNEEYNYFSAFHMIPCRINKPACINMARIPAILKFHDACDFFTSFYLPIVSSCVL